MNETDDRCSLYVTVPPPSPVRECCKNLAVICEPVGETTPGRGQFLVPPPAEELPGGLLARFSDSDTDTALINTLRWLGPISVHVR